MIWYILLTPHFSEQLYGPLNSLSSSNNLTATSNGPQAFISSPLLQKIPKYRFDSHLEKDTRAAVNVPWLPSFLISNNSNLRKCKLLHLSRSCFRPFNEKDNLVCECVVHLAPMRSWDSVTCKAHITMGCTSFLPVQPCSCSRGSRASVERQRQR